MVETFSAHTAQELFADRICLWDTIGCHEISMDVLIPTREKLSMYLLSRACSLHHNALRLGWATVLGEFYRTFTQS